MSESRRAAELFERWVERHVVHGERLAPEELCGSEPGLVAALSRLIRDYDALDATLGAPTGEAAEPPPRDHGVAMPEFEGFRTVERIGGGGGGEVYKLEDIELGRTVAAKVVRRDNALSSTLDDFLREARSLALFEDPRIVRVFEFRRHADPPVLLMEHVEGFSLDRIAPSLEPRQRARLMVEICEAIHHAHVLGLQHRDLKPANILVDARLSPKILDFGLSRAEPDLGHGLGTPSYMAPEQLAPGSPIDARSDVYALGVILYEVLCGTKPFRGNTLSELLDAIRRAEVRLPVEIEPDTPEPLQAIALKAMERDPAERYASARDMALDLRRWLEDRPVLARPTAYQTALGRRVRPHLEQIREWLRLKLIYPHEAERLTRTYRDLEIRDEDWIIQSRVLSLPQISLYLGAFLLLCGSVLYFLAYLNGGVTGVTRPLLVLGLPFLGLNVAARRLWRAEQQAVAVAFCLAVIALLPLLLLILFQEARWWPAGSGPLELFGEGYVSNRQMQFAGLAASAFTLLVALGTRTLTLSTSFTVVSAVTTFAVLTEFGLRRWLEDSQWDALALHLVPPLLLAALGGVLCERWRRSFLARPLYVASAALFVLALELLAQNGKAFSYLGISAAPFQAATVTDPLLLDTLGAMALNGLLIYLTAWLLDRYGSELTSTTSWLLFSVSPFAILEPVAWLNHTGEYSLRYAWLYLALALLVTVFSRFHQRKSFYYAGLLNTGVALWYLTDLHEWWDRAPWSVSIVTFGLLLLGAGFALSRARGQQP